MSSGRGLGPCAASTQLVSDCTKSSGTHRIKARHSSCGRVRSHRMISASPFSDASPRSRSNTMRLRSRGIRLPLISNDLAQARSTASADSAQQPGSEATFGSWQCRGELCPFRLTMVPQSWQAPRDISGLLQLSNVEMRDLRPRDVRQVLRNRGLADAPRRSRSRRCSVC